MNNPECDSLKIANLLKWWPQQQTEVCKQEADLIRNNLLQTVLTIRRDLEQVYEHTVDNQVGGCDSPRERLRHRHLTKLAEIYASLEHLSNRLSLPYLRDSLPLALCHNADAWEQTLHLRTHLPPFWESGPIIHTQLLLTFVNTLCALLAAADRLPRDCGITLTQQSNINEFSFYAIYCDVPPPAMAAKLEAALTPILKTFQLIAPGHYVAETQCREMNWILSWPAKDPIDLS